MTSPRFKRVRLALLILAALVVATAIPIYLTAPKPSAVDFTDVDPAIAKVIERHLLRVRLLPYSGTAWGRLATTFYVHHFNAAAEQAFVIAERLNPREPRWPYLRALSTLEEDLEAAVPMLRRAAELSADGPAAPRLRFAELALERGQFEEALAQLTHVLARDPHDARALLNMGRLEFARGHLAESRAFLERSLERAPNVKATRMLLATVLQRLGEKEASEKQSRTARSLPEKAFWPDPYRQEALAFWTGSDALLNRGKDALGQRQFAEARDLFQKATRDYPKAERAWSGLGSALRALGDRAAARSAFEMALAIAPEAVAARVELGSVFYDEKNYREAERHFREVLRQKPEQVEAWHNLGLTFTAQGRPADAIGAFEKALTLRPQLPDAHIFLGQAFAMTGQLSAAAEHIEQALALRPDDPRAQALRGKIRDALNAAPK